MTDAKEVNFIFICPNEIEMFESSNFKMFDNRDVTTDNVGNKSRDARVVLNEPCPLYGQKHVSHASELLRPLAG